ncbi:hypothetical protein P863_12695 [Mycobacterium avium subsp. silvaticum ATCC 49884]|nr:hypothetical protein P863_12695 [Mycobacterium avium subsp. silvaticum ATCC 49884]
MACSHATYGAAAAAIAMDEGPVHGPVVSVSTVEPYDAPTLCNSAASSSHAAAAASSGPEPAPTYIRPELYSGG